MCFYVLVLLATHQVLPAYSVRYNKTMILEAVAFYHLCTVSSLIKGGLSHSFFWGKKSSFYGSFSFSFLQQSQKWIQKEWTI